MKSKENQSLHRCGHLATSKPENAAKSAFFAAIWLRYRERFAPLSSHTLSFWFLPKITGISQCTEDDQAESRS